MRSERLLKPGFALAAALALAGCGGTEPNATPDMGETGSLLPMATGNVWEYRVTDALGVVTQKRTTVLAQEPVGGTGPHAAVMAFKVVTRKGPNLASETDLDKTESWQGPESGKPARIVRYRELSYGAMTQLLQLEESWDPPRIHVDGTAERTKAGVRWIEKYTETKLPVGVTPPPQPQVEQDLWEVLSGDETVDVPAGRFERTVLVRKNAASGSGAEKRYWFKRGVGKVKEEGTQIEELTKYPPATGATP